jgi:hypothetical protein
VSIRSDRSSTWTGQAPTFPSIGDSSFAGFHAEADEFLEGPARITYASEVNMKMSPMTCRISFAVAALAATVSIGAQAEFRCKSGSFPEDKRACELAKLDRPDDLRRFIQTTRSIYALYFYDYVTEEDFDRWHAARKNEEARAITATADRDRQTGVSR